jgi:hypothetical protein
MYLDTEFDTPVCSGLLVVAIRPKAKDNFHTADMLFHVIII